MDVHDDQFGHPMLSMETRWGGDSEDDLLESKAVLPSLSGIWDRGMSIKAGT